MKKGQVAVERTSFSARNFKGQVAVEFFSYASILLIILVITLSILYVARNTEYQSYRYNYAVEVGKGFANSFSLAVRGGPGFEYTYIMPRTILGRQFNITYINTSVSGQSREFMQISIPGETEAESFAYPYALPYYPFEVGGCIEEFSRTGRIGGTIDPEEGDDKLIFYNDGQKVIITHGGCS